MKILPSKLLKKVLAIHNYAETKLGYVPRGKNSELYMLQYYGHSDLFEARINMFDSNAHPERQFRVTVKVTDRR